VLWQLLLQQTMTWQKDAIATTSYVAIASFATKFVHGNNLFCHGVVTW
jgi:hypothetical protein